eukprot:6199990-Pleurochrysis_carterae.AAC.1
MRLTSSASEGGGGTWMSSGGQDVRPSPCEVTWNVGELATAAETAAGTSVLVAIDAAAVAGVGEATAVARTAETDRTSVGVAAGAKGLPRSRAISR